MRILLSIVLVLICLNGKTVQAETPTDHELELVKRIFQRVKENGEKISTGIFVGTEIVHRKEGDKLVRKPETEVFFCAFDHPKDFYHFMRDTGETFEVHELPSNRYFAKPLQAIYIRRPEYSFHWRSDANSDEIRREKKDASPSDVVKPFDIRCVGLAFAATMERCCDFQKNIKSCRKGKVIGFEEKDGVCRIDMQSKADSGVFYSIWFDSKQDYQPIRIELFLKSLSSPPIQRGEATWKKISGVWVPQTFLGENFHPDGKLREKMKLTFEWKSVNEPVPEENFTPKGMDLPPETRIISNERGGWLPLGTIGKPMKE